MKCKLQGFQTDPAQQDIVGPPIHPLLFPFVAATWALCANSTNGVVVWSQRQAETLLCAIPMAMIARSGAVAGKKHIWLVLPSSRVIRMFSLSLIRAEESLGCCGVRISNPWRVGVGRGTWSSMGRISAWWKTPAIAITDDLKITNTPRFTNNDSI